MWTPSAFAWPATWVSLWTSAATPCACAIGARFFGELSELARIGGNDQRGDVTAGQRVVQNRAEFLRRDAGRCHEAQAAKIFFGVGHGSVGGHFKARCPLSMPDSLGESGVRNRADGEDYITNWSRNSG